MKSKVEEEIESVSLPNGLQMHLVGIPRVRTTLFAIAYNVGSMMEMGFGTGSTDGISHLFEHMAFKGTPSYSTQEVNEAFTRMGAELNAYTSFDHTIYYAKVPTRHLKTAAQIWHDLLLNRRLDSGELKSEKDVVIQEILLTLDNPARHTLFTARKLHFEGTPLEHTILGSPESVRGIDIPMIETYVNKYYTLDNAALGLCGGLQVDEGKEFLTDLFDSHIENPRVNPEHPPPVILGKRDENIKYHTQLTDKPLCYVGLCVDAPGISSEHIFPLLLLNTYIGNSRTSLLYREIISKGIAGVCGYGFEPLFDISAASIFFVAPPHQTPNVFEEVMNTIARLEDIEWTQPMVNTLIEEVWGSYLSEIEDPSSYGVDFLQKFLKFREPIPPEKMYTELVQIDPSEMQKATDSLLKSFKHRFTVFATGTIPKGWEPELPKKWA
ncbi:MAG: M16 family metallopeptidase [Candidatus Heimdallarchaeota archaeon]